MPSKKIQNKLKSVLFPGQSTTFTSPVVSGLDRCVSSPFTWGLRGNWAGLLSWGNVTMATTAAPFCILWHRFQSFDTVSNCEILLLDFIWNAIKVSIFLLSVPQGASALFDMIEYYESATHLNISFNKHIGTRGWQAAAHMMRKVRNCLLLHWITSRKQHDRNKYKDSLVQWEKCHNIFKDVPCFIRYWLTLLIYSDRISRIIAVKDCEAKQ